MAAAASPSLSLFPGKCDSFLLEGSRVRKGKRERERDDDCMLEKTPMRRPEFSPGLGGESLGLVPPFGKFHRRARCFCFETCTLVVPRIQAMF